jgi:hypothetical protein
MPNFSGKHWLLASNNLSVRLKILW